MLKFCPVAKTVELYFLFVQSPNTNKRLQVNKIILSFCLFLSLKFRQILCRKSSFLSASSPTAESCRETSKIKVDFLSFNHFLDSPKRVFSSFGLSWEFSFIFFSFPAVEKQFPPDDEQILKNPNSIRHVFFKNSNRQIVISRFSVVKSSRDKC